ncbi:MAG: hypothetical protein RL885_06585 [Planctomycetota bacterium]
MIACRPWLAAGLLLMACACRTTYEFPERTVQTSAEGLSRLELNHDVGEIHIMCSRTDKIEIRSRTTIKTRSRSRAEALHEARRLEMKRVGDDLIVQWPEAFSSYRSEATTDLDVILPADLRLAVMSEVGDVVVEDANSSVSVLTAVGDIDIRCRQSQQIYGFSRVGDVAIEGNPRLLRATSEVGDVDAWCGPDLEDVEMRSKVGDVTLYLPEGIVPQSLSASTTVGSLAPPRRPEEGMTGPTVIMHTTTGDVSVRRNDRRISPKFY